MSVSLYCMLILGMGQWLAGPSSPVFYHQLGWVILLSWAQRGLDGTIAGTKLEQWNKSDKHTNLFKSNLVGTLRWLRLYASNAVGLGLIPGWGTKRSHRPGYSQKKKVFNWLVLPLASSLTFWLCKSKKGNTFLCQYLENIFPDNELLALKSSKH